MASQMPDNTQINFDSEVLDLDVSGTLLAVWPVTPPAVVAGTLTTAFAQAQGARIDWSTSTIVAGRRLTGRTYVVPIASGGYTTDGVLTGATVTALQTAANAFITATSAGRPLRVWSRTHATDAVVASASVPLKGAILRGRRD